MNIHQMHESFRVIGQQMGMQLFRGILPESIDVYLNNVIIEKTQIDLLSNLKTVLQDNVNMQGSTMSPINLFRSLYRSARFRVLTTSEEIADETAKHADYQNGTKTILQICKSGEDYNAANGYHKIWMPTLSYKDYRDNADGKSYGLFRSNEEYFINPMLYLGFSVEYDNTSQGNSTSCRLIGADMLETTFRDYCNGASKKEPIVTMVSHPLVVNDEENIKGISNEYLEFYSNTKGLEVKYLTIKYIKTPNVVKWDVDINKCVDCDLPDYTHYEIVERAVSKFFNSVGVGQPDRSRGQRSE